jgi:hypothetical protein
VVLDDNSEFYDPESRELPAGARCANHPERPATAACQECARPVCGECAPLTGGGHAFCRECLAASRLVDAEPRVLGAPDGSEPVPSPVAGGVSGRRLYLMLIMLALAAIGAAAAWAALSGR